MEHITAQEAGNARYGLDMTLHKGHVSLNKPWARCCRTAAFLVPRLSPIFSLFYKCIFQVFPFTSVSETSFSNPGVHLFMGIPSDHLQPK